MVLIKIFINYTKKNNKTCKKKLKYIKIHKKKIKYITKQNKTINK